MKKIITLLILILFAFSLCGCESDNNSAEKTTSSQISTTGATTVVVDNKFTLSANEYVKNITVGWNLGNTLEACKSWGDIPDNPTPKQQETGWNNPVTTKKMIDYIAASGFNAVRIPVTWYLQVSENDGKYTINKDWMKRVKQVAGYCLDNNLYTIVNMHHDDGDWLDISKKGAAWKAVKNEYKQLWKQIATEFRNYGEKLILEGANEITYANSGEKCWWGHDDGSHFGGDEKNCFSKQNELYDLFVKTVRKSGGNNDKRYLCLPTYGAQWYEHQIENLTVPDGDDHIIMDIHWYSCSQTDEKENKPYFDTMRKYADERNIGVIIGECGVTKNTEEEMKTSWANVFVRPAKELQIPCFLWDDGGDLQILQRNEETLSFNSQAYVDAVMTAAGVK